jgi:hypothetical protein
MAAAGLLVGVWNDRTRFGRAVVGIVTGVAIVSAIAVPLEYGVRTHLAPAGHYFPQFSPQALLALLMPAPIAAALVFGACAAVTLRGVREIVRGNVNGAAAIALSVWFALPNPYPWYALWILPVAFLTWGSRQAWAIVAASLLAVLRYYGEATTDLSPGLTAALLAVQFGVPLAVASGLRTNRARPDRREIRTSAPDFAPLRSE